MIIAIILIQTVISQSTTRVINTTEYLSQHVKTTTEEIEGISETDITQTTIETIENSKFETLLNTIANIAPTQFQESQKKLIQLGIYIKDKELGT